MHSPASFAFSSARFLLCATLFWTVLGPISAHAQLGTGNAPSAEALVEALPDTLPDRERTRARQSDPFGVTGVYERTAGEGPPRVDIRIMYGTMGQRQAENFIQRSGTDSTTTENGRTLYSGVVKMDSPQGIVLWRAGPFVVGVEAHGSKDQDLTAEGAEAALPKLRRLLVNHMSSEDLPEVESAED
jgi:hypothetical protein